MPGAEHLCRQILEAEPEHADALHLLGVVALQTGRVDLAAESISRVLHVRPDFAEAHSNLAIALQQQGKLGEAIGHWREAARLKPDFAPVHNYLAIAQMQQGNPAAALASWRDAVRADPNYADALNNLAVALYQQGAAEEAVGYLRRAVDKNPDHRDAQRNLANMLRELGRPAEAVECRRQLVRLRPGDADAWNDLGTALKQQGDPAQAAASFEQALRLRPDYAGVVYNLANTLREQGRLADAVARYRQAIHLSPGYAEAHGSLGVALLLQGNFAEGWREYQWRHQTQPPSGPSFPEPPWNGAPLAGRTILLHAEQGMGDTLQFVRYARVLRRQGARVLVGCPPGLVPLLKSSPDIDAVVSDGPQPAYDEHAALLDLPAILRTSLADVPAEVPYLFAEPQRIAHWHQQLSTELRPAASSRQPACKIGIAWQGNPTYRDDRWRSIPLAEFAPLARVPGVQLISLQKGYGSEQVPQLADRVPVLDVASRLDQSGGAFLDTAAVIKCLDLVITSDTAIAHLAGALGVPVWLALSFVPDWRWLMGREDCPWYPTMRLFRQPNLGNWPAVFQRMAGELERQLGIVRTGSEQVP